jgi:hypothetical protein
MISDTVVGRRDLGAEGTVTPGRGRFIGRVLVVAFVGLWALLAVLETASTTIAAARAGKADFFMILDASLQWEDGLPAYQPRRLVGEPGALRPARPNLNHPITIPLLVPFTRLPQAPSFLLWDGLGLAAFLVAVALAVRATHLRLTRASGALLVAALVTCPGVIYGLQLGQWGLLLSLPIVAGWLLLRESTPRNERWRTIAAGLLLGGVVTLKPFLLPLLVLFLPRRRWPGLLAAGASGATLSALALPLLGLGAYFDWFRALRSIDWYDHGLNLSLNGFLHRVVPQPIPGVIGWVLQGLAVVLGIVVVGRGADSRPVATDRAVGVLLLLSLLGSPLGWLYYTPMIIIPALLPSVATWPTLAARRRRFLGAATLLLWMPIILEPLWPNTLWGDLTVRAAPTYGLVALLTLLLLAGVRGSRDGVRASLAADEGYTGGLRVTQPSGG